MRIALIGQAAFGEAVFTALRQHGHEVVGVFVPPNPPGGRAGPLQSAATDAGVRVYQPGRLRDPEVLSQVGDLHADLALMAYVTSIAPPDLFSTPRLGAIQYHPSLLPRHRGGSAINWAIINDEERTGLTIFWPDGGVDTGPILLQKEVEIGSDDTTGSLYFGKLFPMGVQAILDAVALVDAGVAPRLPQDEQLATYEPLCTAGRCVIDWSRTRQDVYNLIRGANPQPGANCVFRGTRVGVFDTVLWDELVPAGPGGEIAEVLADGIVVQTSDRPLLVKRVQPYGGVKMAASEWVASNHVRAGERFG